MAILKTKCVGFLVFCIAVALLTLGIALFIASFMNPEVVTAHVSRFSPDGTVSSLTRKRLECIFVRLRVMSAALIAAGILIYVFRRNANNFVFDLSRSAIACFQGIAIDTLRWARLENRLHVLLLAIVTLLGLLVRMRFLHLPMRCDEAFSVLTFAHKPLYIALSYYLPNNHIFYTLITHFLDRTVGMEPWIVRLHALCAGVLLIPACYLMVRSVYGRHAALLSAAFVSTSSILVEYSVRARGYSMLCLFSVLMFVVATRLITKPSLGWWLLLSLISAAGFYTLPVMLYPFGGLIVWLTGTILAKYEGNAKQMFKHLMVWIMCAGTLVLLLYSPVLIVSGLNSIIANPYVSRLSWTDFLAKLPILLREIWYQWNRDVPTGVSFILMVGFLVSLAFNSKLTPSLPPPIAAILLWVVPFVAIHRVIPFARVWLFLLPFYIGTSAAGLTYLLEESLRRSRLSSEAVVCFLSLALCGVIGFNTLNRSSIVKSTEKATILDANDIATYLKSYLKDGDLVRGSIITEPVLKYYLVLHGVQRKCMWWEVSNVKRVIFIVKKNKDINLFAREKGFTKKSYSSPKLLRRFRYANIYEILPTRPSKTASPPGN